MFPSVFTPLKIVKNKTKQIRFATTVVVVRAVTKLARNEHDFSTRANSDNNEATAPSKICTPASCNNNWEQNVDVSSYQPGCQQLCT